VLIAAMLFLSAPAVQAVQPGAEASEEDIVIIGERLRKVRFKLKRDGKAKVGTCRITRASGDPSLDDMVCKAAVDCMGEKKITMAAWTDCMNPQMKTIAQARRDQRRAARDRK
jgi:hypothetical protein